MNYWQSLFLSQGITQSLLLITLTITIGLWLGEHARTKHFSLGITWVLLVGIALSAIGLSIDPSVAHFAKDFGLILFVYSIGLQVGPSFAASFKSGGIKLIMLAAGVVLLGCLCTISLHYLTGIDMGTMAGIMSGAVINTPSLAAAEQAFTDVTGEYSPTIATGYAVAYPLAVVGVILSFGLIRWMFRVNLETEDERLQKESSSASDEPVCVDIKLDNPQLTPMNLTQLQKLCPVKMVVSRVIRPNGTDEVATQSTIFGNGDTIRVLTDKSHLEPLKLLGKMQTYSYQQKENSDHLVSRRIVVTNTECNGKRIGHYDLRGSYHATITRVNRAGIDLLATPDLVLQLGDRVMIVGDKNDVQKVADIFGNELKRLDIPNLLPIFFGIVLGVILGTIPFPIPGMSQSFKLGLAGGSLIVSLLIGRFGPYYKMVTFATTSANRMLREVGLLLFMAAVGLTAGDAFIPTIMSGGYLWVGYGFLITMIPLLIIGSVGYKGLKINYFKIVGMLTGSMTAAPCLPYAESLSDKNNQATVCYATVYPVTMFLRVMAGQLLVILLCA